MVRLVVAVRHIHPLRRPEHCQRGKKRAGLRSGLHGSEDRHTTNGTVREGAGTPAKRARVLLDGPAAMRAVFLIRMILWCRTGALYIEAFLHLIMHPLALGIALR